jgi:hypothetical protein
MKKENQDLLQQLLKTVRFHKDEMTKNASKDAFVSPDTNSPGLFFITETFRELTEVGRNEPLLRRKARYQIHQPKDLLEIASQRHRLFYKHILNQTVPSNHFPSRKKDYPIALSFIDLAGARQNQHAFFQMPHFHSIVIVPPKTMPRFNVLLSDSFRLIPKTTKTEHIKTARADEVPWDWSEIKNVLSYSAKTYLSDVGSKYFSENDRSLFFQMHG